MDLVKLAQLRYLPKQADGDFEKGDYKKALQKYLKIAEIILESERYSELAPYYMKIAQCYGKLKGRDDEREKFNQKAGEYYTKSAEMLKRQGKYLEAASSYGNAAKAYENAGDYKTAAQYSEKAANIYLEKNDNFSASAEYNNAAKYHERVGDSGTASQYYVKAGDMDLELKDYPSAAASYSDAANCYNQAGNYKTAIDYYLKAIGFDQSAKRYDEVAKLYDLIAKCYEHQGDHKNALRYYMESVRYSKDINDAVSIIRSYKNVAQSYEKLGEHEKSIENYITAADLSSDLRDYGNAFESYLGAATGYEKTGNLVKAAEYYALAAKASLSNKNERDALRYYTRATELGIELAKRETDKEKSAGHYIRAADGFRDIREYGKAADNYLKFAELMADVNHDRAVDGYKKAAEMFIEMDDLYSAGNAYVMAGEFVNATHNYINHGDVMVKQGLNLHAANGYMRAAECYHELKNEELEHEYYDRAIWNYTRYFKTNQDTAENTEELGMIAEAYKNAAECYRNLKDLQKASDHFKGAVEFYKRAGWEDETTITSAFLAKVDGELAVEHGYYENADKLLNSAVKYFESALKIEDLTPVYRERLKQNLEDIKNILKKVKVKPDVVLELNEHSRCPVGKQMILDGAIRNLGEHIIRKIMFLSHLPEELELEKIPGEIDELKPKESRKIALVIKAGAAGTFKLKPLEAIYEDELGTKYVKASNEVLIDVGGTAGVKLGGRKIPGADKGKPQVDLVLEKPPAVKMGQKFSMNGKVMNRGGEEVTDVRIMQNLPDEFELVKPPEEIKVLKPGEVKGVELELKARKHGEYRFSPLEMFYHDRHGGRFFKAAEEVDVVVKKK